MGRQGKNIERCIAPPSAIGITGQPNRTAQLLLSGQFLEFRPLGPVTDDGKPEVGENGLKNRHGLDQTVMRFFGCQPGNIADYESIARQVQDLPGRCAIDLEVGILRVDAIPNDFDLLKRDGSGCHVLSHLLGNRNHPLKVSQRQSIYRLVYLFAERHPDPIVIGRKESERPAHERLRKAA